MGKRELVSAIAMLAIGGLLAIIVRDQLVDQHADRRFALYHVRRELRAGMSRAEVEAVISRHQAPYVEKVESGDAIRLTVRMGGRNWLYLDITFSGGAVVGARFAGEDSLEDVPDDAPPNIG